MLPEGDSVAQEEGLDAAAQQQNSPDGGDPPGPVAVGRGLPIEHIEKDADDQASQHLPIEADLGGHLFTSIGDPLVCGGSCFLGGLLGQIAHPDLQDGGQGAQRLQTGLLAIFEALHRTGADAREFGQLLLRPGSRQAVFLDPVGQLHLDFSSDEGRGKA